MERSDAFMKSKTFSENIYHDKTFEGKAAMMLQVTSQFLVGWDYENTFPVGRT